MESRVHRGRRLPRLAVVIGATCASASAQISFETPIAYTAGTEPHTVALADFDGDLDIDIVATVHSPPALSFMANQGNATFAVPVISPLSAGTDPVGLVVRDFTGDGHLDVLVAQSGTGTVKLMRNLVDGTFVPGDHVHVGDRPELMAAGDFDGDGDDDVVVANRASDDVTFIRNLGAGEFERIHTLGVGGSPRGVAVGDFVGAAHLDVVVACHGARRLDVLANDGTGTFTRALSLAFGATEQPEDVAAADFDGDGDADLVATLGGPNVNHLGVFRQVSPGSFCACDYSPTGGLHPVGLAAADFDFDTRLDLAIVHSGSDQVSVLPNTSDPLFGAPIVYDVLGPQSDFVAVADLDRDHYLDLVVTDDLGDTVSVLVNELQNPRAYCISTPNSWKRAAHIGSTGSVSIATDDFTLTVDGAARFAHGLFFYGAVPTEAPYFAGYLCVNAPMARLGPVLQADELGDASRRLEFGLYPAAGGPLAIGAGSVWNFQFWYRDPGASPGPTTNFSDGLRVVFEP